MISVSILENGKPALEWLSVLVSRTPGYQLRTVHSSAREALKTVQRVPPDLLLLGAAAQDSAACDTVRAFAEAIPRVPIIVRTVPEPDHALALLAAGACGLIPEDAPPVQILHALATAHEGGSPLPPCLVRGLVRRVQEQSRRKHSLANLSSRERQILALLAEGLDNREIAARLNIGCMTDF